MRRWTSFNTNCPPKIIEFRCYKVNIGIIFSALLSTGLTIRIIRHCEVGWVAMTESEHAHIDAK
jgi:hypothetical protein